LLYYPTFYEGLEQSKNVIYTGQERRSRSSTPQLVAKEKGAKTSIIGSDYIWRAPHEDRPQAHRERTRGRWSVKSMPLGLPSSVPS